MKYTPERIRSAQRLVGFSDSHVVTCPDGPGRRGVWCSKCCEVCGATVFVPEHIAKPGVRFAGQDVAFGCSECTSKITKTAREMMDA